MTPAMRVAVGLAAGVLSVAAVVAAVMAFRPPPPPRPTPVPRSRRRVTVSPTTAATAVAAGLLVLVVTRWLVAAAAAAGLVVVWSGLFQSSVATAERRRVAAIAKWLEDLRDLQRGSNLDLPQALDRSALRAPKDIEAELGRFVDRMRHHSPLDEALLALAVELDHPTSDMAIAAMLFAYGHASGSTLYDTFEELAVSARDELAARDQIDRLRTRFESAMRRMLVILAALIAYLLVALGRDAGRVRHADRAGLSGRADRHLGVRLVVAAQPVALPARRPLPRLPGGVGAHGGGVAVTVLQLAVAAATAAVLAGWCLWRAFAVGPPSVAAVYRRLYGGGPQPVAAATSRWERPLARIGTAVATSSGRGTSRRDEAVRVARRRRHRRRDRHAGGDRRHWSGSSPRRSR